MLVKFGKYRNTKLFHRLLGLKPKRKEVVRIDKHDFWNMDRDLAKIIYPMLVKLKESKQGSPFVDYEDVPEELRPTEEEMASNRNLGEVDDKFHERWEYVLDKIIYSFKRCNEEWEKDFYENVPSSDNISVFGNHYDISFDEVGYKKEHEKIMEGLRLFAKYYFHLFD